ncbi:glycoside hydrolase family 25 domain-containing protein [Saccharomonospora iraqiensis]|uniref:hypothetical protein n=1 Tax=Saccharomonospora iraqiensis TaxID=52698 RepID=UPI00022E5A30|nr:hypothetical protein [Saccharomonospora iraqiensis]
MADEDGTGSAHPDGVVAAGAAAGSGTTAEPVPTTGISLATGGTLSARSVPAMPAFVAVLVTEGPNGVASTAARLLGDMLRAGVRAGLRHHADPGGAREQARHMVRTGLDLGAFAPGALAPSLDVRAEGVDDRFVRTWVRTVRRVAEIRTVLVHGDDTVWRHRLRPDRWADDDVILTLARHNGVPGRPGWFHPRLGTHEYAAGHGVGHEALVYPFTLGDLLL